MFRTLPEARPILRDRIQKAVARTLENIVDGGVRQEPQITDRFMARIEDEISDVKLSGVHFRSVTFTDRGKNSEESRFGSDFAGFLSIQYSNSKVVKVFLAQAKLGNDVRGVGLENLAKHEQSRLLDQVNDMLLISPESYIVVYTKSTIKFFPALSIKNVVKNGDPKYWHEISRHVSAIDAVSFYEQHFECFIGDTTIQKKINFPLDTVENLKRALEILKARSGQSILVTTDKPLIRSLENRG